MMLEYWLQPALRRADDPNRLKPGLQRRTMRTDPCRSRLEASYEETCRILRIP